MDCICRRRCAYVRGTFAQESRVCARKRPPVHTQCTDVVLPFRSPPRRHLVQRVLLDLFETLQIREWRSRSKAGTCRDTFRDANARGYRTKLKYTRINAGATWTKRRVLIILRIVSQENLLFKYGLLHKHDVRWEFILPAYLF